MDLRLSQAADLGTLRQQERDIAVAKAQAGSVEQPVSALVVIHTLKLDVLLLERAKHPGSIRSNVYAMSNVPAPIYRTINSQTRAEP